MKNKNLINKLNRDYIKTPKISMNIGLESNPYHVLGAMLECGEGFNPSLAYLEKKCFLSRPSLTRAIKVLLDQNIIKLVSRGQGRSVTRYCFNNPEHWLSKKQLIKSSVERDKIMRRSRIAGGKANTAKRHQCPKGLVIDFIIPLNNEWVSGLNVPWNMQFLTFEDTVRKGRSFDGTYDNTSWRKKYR